jgi:hypothetical protein
MKMNGISIQELGEILKDCELYRCKSATCSDNGGVCHLIIPTIFDKPQDGREGCCYPDDFEDECECKWERVA